jgi:hypothetical protein
MKKRNLASIATRSFLEYVLEEDPRLNQAQVARVCGYPHQRVSDALYGRGGSLNFVAKMIANWNEAQDAKLRLVTDGNTAWVVEGWGG